MKSEIVIDDIVTDKNELIVNFHCNGEIDSLIEMDSFKVSYDFDLNEVPESIIIIPFLANICPLAWAMDATIYCNQIDFRFYLSLNELKHSLQSMYPSLSWVGDINPNFIVNNEKKFEQSGNAGLFFNGGISSISSFIQRRHEMPRLIAVKDTEFEEKNEPTVLTEQVHGFAKRKGISVSEIETNYRSIFNEEKLNAAFFDRIGGEWWTKVQQGLAMIGLGAPMTYHYQISTLYLSATQNPAFVKPAGSHPELDNHIRWGSDEFRVIHQGYSLTRHEKITLISHYIKKHDQKLPLKICRETTDGSNCSTCEKCTRTMLSLLVEGMKPEDHGFIKVDAEWLSKVREQMENNDSMTPQYIHWYQDIQRYITHNKNELPEYSLPFFEWFEKVNMKHMERTKRYKEKWYTYKKKVKRKLSKGEEIQS